MQSESTAADGNATPEATASTEQAPSPEATADTDGGTKQKRWIVLAFFLLFATAFALSNGFGNFLVTDLAAKIAANVKYPIITGGNLVFSMLAGLLFKERITWRKLVTLAIVVTGTVLMML